MQFNYDLLWKLLIDKQMKKKDLKNMTHLAPATIAKLSKNEPVSMEVLGKICIALECNIGDIVSIK